MTETARRPDRRRRTRSNDPLPDAEPGHDRQQDRRAHEEQGGDDILVPEVHAGVEQRDGYGEESDQARALILHWGTPRFHPVGGPGCCWRSALYGRIRLAPSNARRTARAYGKVA